MKLIGCMRVHPSLQARGVDVDQGLGFEAIDYAGQQALIDNSDVVIGGQP